MNTLKLLAGVSTLLMLISGCEQTDNTRDDTQLKELTELRTEIEQLTNAVGRLEFRVYELENHHSTTGIEQPADMTPIDEAEKVPGAKRYDLTPAE